MGLGIRRDRTGDIVLGTEGATLFVEAPLAETVLSGLTEAGRIRLSAARAEAADLPAAPQGEEVRFTVQSARLDAVVADGFHLSRGDAAALIEAGAVKLRHVPTLRPDARVAEGDAISVRGYGRLTIETIGLPTRKGRLPVTLTRHGAPR
jgi:RNA-binding protein YlmH